MATDGAIAHDLHQMVGPFLLLFSPISRYRSLLLAVFLALTTHATQPQPLKYLLDRKFSSRILSQVAFSLKLRSLSSRV